MHYPILSRADFVFFRLLGPGLGNLLFPLYRAFQSQKNMGGVVVFPQFFQMKLGPFLRFEKDNRTYFNLFNPREIDDVLRHVKAIFTDWVPEEQLSQASNYGQVEVIRYEGLKGYFKDLDMDYIADFSEYLLRRASHADQLRDELASISKRDVCVHLRRGDFMLGSANADASGGMCYRIADEWYVKAVSIALARFPGAKVRVFTDSTDLDPKLLKALHCTAVDKSRNALHALMKMSAHGAIIASKSSFSLWSAFLGRQYIYITNEFDLGLYARNEQLDYERV